MYKHPVTTGPIKGTNWTLHFNLKESTGGHTSEGTSVNFTCASAVMWNINFKRNSDGYSMYSHLGPTLVPLEERYHLYGELVKRYVDNTFMVQLVGVVNGATEARLKHYLASENRHGYHTFDFANYLITQGVGVVVESPVFLNTYHGWEGPSICQAWFWFSPSILKEGALVERTGGIHGLDKVTKFLDRSDLKKENVGSFDGLLNPSIVKEDRFAEARSKWNASMEMQGITTSKKDSSKNGELKWKKAV